MYGVYALAYVTTVYVSYRVLRTFFSLLWSITLYLIIPNFYRPGLGNYRPRWTVVSGGTDGIGKAYMFELAARGLRKFVLIGRSEKKLETVKSELETKYNCQVKTYLFDFFDGDYDALREYLNTIDIGFVVNSVGVGREYLERYGDNPKADQQILKVNAYGSADFISCVLAPMERHGGGQIVVLSSSQGFRPIPLLAAYSSAKSLISFICEAVDREYKTISVQCLTPALIATKMTYYQSGSLFVVTPENFCRQAVNTLGLAKITSGCFNHEIQMLLRHLFPWAILKYMIMPIYWRHQKRMIRLHGPANMSKGNEPTDVKSDNSTATSEMLSSSPKPSTKPSGIPRKLSLNSIDKVDLEKRKSVELENRIFA
ncbi:hypothetical protein M3Y94_01218700 [Aphelenchoides besseyi]|nr:hypothetical protein M3Y94_01218700 [Aphelenchoides besseyi]